MSCRHEVTHPHWYEIKCAPKNAKELLILDDLALQLLADCEPYELKTIRTT